MRPIRTRAALSWGLLVTSIGANVALAVACLELYRREQRVRLHPTFPVPTSVASPADKQLVLFLGDSRMQEWPALPADSFVTVNAGGGGETTAQVRLRAAPTLDAIAPRLVVLQAGINDLKAIGALPDAAREIEQQCLANLSALVELCRQHGARVVLLPILPAAQPSLARRPVWSSDIEAARVRVNAALRNRFGTAAGVAMLADNLVIADTAADYRDTLHLRPTTYVKLESAAVKALETLLSTN